ncbi:WD domain-containing protein [Massarina eburnea CBS 473.64]|uniref:WD domain-containing protein n=1 Tax=Massarina eburnea CBS 473.64 TaxID=1395130 RepID=A0A6A6S2Y3_9PLEO|nr:WD domain-containing protein [Massarina eburnea CBS 473.64]
MSRSDDPGHYFQTTSAINEEARKASKANNTKGKPVKLPSKLLAVVADPENEEGVFVAEAAGTVKRVLLENGEIAKTYSGPTAPLTSLAISPTSRIVYAGCWDKSIWSWNMSSGRPGTRFQGHADFVKAVLLVRLQGKELLVSGSADATIIVWDAGTGQKLHTLKGHTRAILALALDPLEYEPDKESAVVFSAGSDREIRRWTIGVTKAEEIKDEPSPILVHETSVSSLSFDSDGDLWTASADHTAKCLSRTQSFAPDTSFEHADYVRDAVVDEAGGWVVTACRDENVRVWEKGSGKLHHVFVGHWEEVTGLVMVGGRNGRGVVSVGIDGTLRRWKLDAKALAEAIKEAEDEKDGVVKEEEGEGEKKPVMTEEEEAELAALMEDSDE